MRERQAVPVTSIDIDIGGARHLVLLQEIICYAIDMRLNFSLALENMQMQYLQSGVDTAIRSMSDGNKGSMLSIA